eukprot:1189979-Prorocentrum_minimum.AAC.1
MSTPLEICRSRSTSSPCRWGQSREGRENIPAVGTNHARRERTYLQGGPVTRGEGEYTCRVDQSREGRENITYRVDQSREGRENITYRVDQSREGRENIPTGWTSHARGERTYLVQPHGGGKVARQLLARRQLQLLAHNLLRRTGSQQYKPIKQIKKQLPMCRKIV